MIAVNTDVETTSVWHLKEEEEGGVSLLHFLCGSLRTRGSPHYLSPLNMAFIRALSPSDSPAIASLLAGW